MIHTKINGMPMSQSKVEAYLKKIKMDLPDGFPESKTPDLAYLSKLQMAHMSAIPYSNLDTLAGNPASMDRDALYKKIILDGKGGLCSELNTLYNWLLESLGYSVTSYMARITGTSAPVQAPSHRIIGVKINEKTYLSDVGYNYEHHRIPLLLEADLIQPDGECDYRLERDDFFGWVMWQNRPQVGWRKKLGFTEEPHIDLDFVPVTFYAENHPDSFINKSTKVSLYIDGTFHAIRAGNYLIEHGGVEEIIEPITSTAQEQAILRRVFGL